MEVLTERTGNILLDDDDEEEEHVESRVGLKDRRLTKSQACRRRRRSSARFLQLRDEDNDDANDTGDGNGKGNGYHGEGTDVPHDNLGEVYQNAIRMNAENRINASNSWNLTLIDHMDRFLMSSGRPSSAALEDTLGPVTGVNFTKASCTLDASVKIYSYRVDDVHLTSYKVLANLNRTDASGTTNDTSTTTSVNANANANSGKHSKTQSDGDTSHESRQERRAARNNTETLETNIANINIHKLDAAFDIDPLFHKMSKTFDEGGAKGLLLANLGVSTSGCNIVFDSTLDTDDPPTQLDQEQLLVMDTNTSSKSINTSTAVDVSMLTAKIDASLNGQPIHHIPLVPQLASLRSEFALLKDEGFVDQSKPSRRYAAPKEAEAEADRSIHVEAIERSRASQADIGRSLMAEKDDDTFASRSHDHNSGDDDDADDAGFTGLDFGDADDDYDDEGVRRGEFPSTLIHDGDHRFSSESFQTTFEASQPPSQVTILLDAIASGNISGSQSNYEFFNKKALQKFHENQWAGAAHWKKIQQKRYVKVGERDNTGSATVTKKRKGKSSKSCALGAKAFDISKISTATVAAALQMPTKGRKNIEPLQMTKVAISKASKNENILPLSAGIEVETFTSFFLRPRTNVRDIGSSTSISNAPPRQVGFRGVDDWEKHDEDNSWGGDDDGDAVMDFGGNSHDDDDSHDFLVPELEGVRKVEKVKVGYATVAKKVDVKRLKQDLWQELEKTFQEREKMQAIQGSCQGPIVAINDMKRNQNIEESKLLDDLSLQQEPLSFRETIRDMQATQSQADVTLPFYFICILHLANEKGLALESMGLDDFVIHNPCT